MQSIPGNHPSINPFEPIEVVGLLLFAEFPSTALFADREGQPIVREWVDCSEEEKIDRYFYFRTNSNNLSLFTSGIITHQQFVKIAEGEIYYFEDINDSEEVVKKAICTSFDSLPLTYRPGEVYITQEDIVDADRIYNAFINNERDTLDSKVHYIASDTANETYNLHLREGASVGYGTVKTELLGQLLVDFNSLYQEAALDQFVGRRNASKKAREKHQSFINTDVYMQMAASYSVLLKPRGSMDYFGEDQENNSSVRTARKLFGLINQSFSQGLIDDNLSDYSPRVIEAYRTFIQNVRDSKADLDFSWHNPASGVMHKAILTHEKSSVIFSNIESLSTSTDEILSKVGRFDNLNCSTGHFGFISGELINGYFAPGIKEGMRLINFVDAYTVSITRTTKVIPGKREPKIEHTIDAYFKESEQQRDVERADVLL